MKTWKALIIGDLHWTAMNPVARKDSFKDALAAKLRECWEIGRREQVNAIIQTGDLFHSTGIVYSTLAELFRLLQEAPAPIYAVAGNHDLFAGSPESLYRTPIGFLCELAVIRELSDRPVEIPEFNLTLTGAHYSPSVDELWYPYVPRTLYPNSIFRIHVTHGMLVDKPIPGRHTLIDSLDGQTLPRVIVNGHYHLGTGIRRIRNRAGQECAVINPGALGRLTAAVEEMERPIEVALLETDGEDLDARLIALETALPGDEVLSREHLERQAVRELRRAEFSELVAGVQSRQALDLAEMAQEIATQKNLSPEVKEAALHRLAIAQGAVMEVA